MKPLTYIHIFPWLVLMSSLGYSQEPGIPRRSVWKDSSEIRLHVQFSSDYYYMGRADSSRVPYLSSSLGYYHKTGFFIRGGGSYLTSTGEGRMDLFVLSGGYRFQGARLEAGASLAQYFFNDDSYAVQAEMNTFLKVYGGYDLSWVMVYADAGLGFSDDPDVFLGLEINRPFYVFRDRWRIIPAVYVNMGTQHYYNAYYVSRSGRTGKGKGGNGGGSGPLPTATLAEAQKFELLDYEADLQALYTWKKARFMISGTWTFPVHPATVITSQETYTEDLKNGFYWMTGVRFTF